MPATTPRNSCHSSSRHHYQPAMARCSPKSAPLHLVASLDTVARLLLFSIILLPLLFLFYVRRTTSSSSFPLTWSSLSSSSSLTAPPLQSTEDQHHHRMTCSLITDDYRLRPPPGTKQLELLSYNSRSYCRTADNTDTHDNEHVCVSENALEGFPSTSSTDCEVTMPSTTHAFPREINCTELREKIFCVHGYFPHPKTPQCPMESVLESAAASSTVTSVQRTYLNSSTTMIVIPAYPHLGNIFHFSFVAATSAFLAVTHGDRPQQAASAGGEDILQHPRHVSFVFRGHLPKRLGKWQIWVMQAMVRRLEMVGIQADIYALGQNDVDDQKKQEPASVRPAFCAQRAIIMGPRYTVNLWPFPTGVQVRYIDITNKHILVHNNDENQNSTASHSSPTIASAPVLKQRKSDMLILTPLPSAAKFSAQSLSPQPNSPVESLAWRIASYNHANLSTYLPRILVHGIHSAPTETWTDLPPLVLGYARRNTAAVRDPAPGHYVTGGPIRRLSDADEDWLMSMLRNETRQAGMEFRVIETNRDMGMLEQVSIFHGTGVVVGLHGANLVNAMFMAPFSALVEISPINMPCYNGGMNSGLVAWRVITNRVASPEESACPPWHQRCKTDRLERRVLVDEQDVRARVEYAVKHAIAHVRSLRQRFRKYEAVPIRLKQDAATYFIDWDK